MEVTLRSDVVRDVILNRRSVRQFKDLPLKDEDLQKILEAGIYAPSGSNSQNQRFLVLTDRSDLASLGEARFIWPYPTSTEMRDKKPSGLIGGAACAIVVFADAALTDARDSREYYIWEMLETQNCAASIENMLNMATAVGVGSCWLSASSNMSRTRLTSNKSWATVFARYAIPKYYKIQGIVILGYPKNLDENAFAKGERMHGATFWQKTERESVENYLIGLRSPAFSDVELSTLDKLKLLLSSKISGFLLRLMRRVDQWSYDVEVKKALARILAEHAKRT